MTWHIDNTPGLRELIIEVWEDADQLFECNPQYPPFDELDRCPEGHEFMCGMCDLYYRWKKQYDALQIVDDEPKMTYCPHGMPHRYACNECEDDHYGINPTVS